jgi:hypothetical protein
MANEVMVLVWLRHKLAFLREGRLMRAGQRRGEKQRDLGQFFAV